MLPAWSSLLIRWAYTVNVVLTSRWPMSSAMSMGLIPAATQRLAYVWRRAMEYLGRSPGQTWGSGLQEVSASAPGTGVRLFLHPPRSYPTARFTGPPRPVAAL